MIKSPTIPARLTPKQQRFVEELPACSWNATEAAIRAGYSRHTASVIAAQNLRKLSIAREIEAVRNRLAREAGINAVGVLNELARVAFANILDYVVPQPDGTVVVDLSKLTHDKAAAIAFVKVEEWKKVGADGAIVKRTITFKLHDKLAALHKLGVHFGLFTPRTVVTEGPEPPKGECDLLMVAPDECDDLANLLLKSIADRSV